MKATTTLTAREQIIMAMAGRSKNEKIELSKLAASMVERGNTPATMGTTQAAKYTSTTRKPKKPRKPRKTRTKTPKTNSGGAIFEEDGEALGAAI